jgi:hypothetical protein
VNAACHQLPICERIARSLHDRAIKVISKVRKNWKRSLAYIEIGTPLSLSLSLSLSPIYLCIGRKHPQTREKSFSQQPFSTQSIMQPRKQNVNKQAYN